MSENSGNRRGVWHRQVHGLRGRAGHGWKWKEKRRSEKRDGVWLMHAHRLRGRAGHGSEWREKTRVRERAMNLRGLSTMQLALYLIEQARWFVYCSDSARHITC